MGADEATGTATSATEPGCPACGVVVAASDDCIVVGDRVIHATCGEAERTPRHRRRPVWSRWLGWAQAQAGTAGPGA